MPALPLHEAGKYVAGAYVVFLALLLIYVAIMATRLARLDEQLEDLAVLAENRAPARASDEVAGRAAEPAAPMAPEPDDAAAEGEDVGGVIQEGAGG